MDTQIRFLAHVIIHLIFLFIHTLAQSHGGEDKYSDCSQQYNCGTLKDISYPFWGNYRPRDCGSDAFELQCRDNQTTKIVSGPAHFRVVKINQTANTMRMVPEDLIYNDCQFTNTSLNADFFHYLPSVQNVTIFSGCNSGLSIGGNNFTCPILKNDLAFYVNQTQVRQFPELRKQCKFCFQVPALAEIPLEPGGGIDALKEALKQGFDVGYTADWSSCDACMKSGGVCGGESQFSCRCWDGSSQLSACPELKQKTKAIQVVLAVAAIVITAVILTSAWFYTCGRSFSSQAISVKPSEKIDFEKKSIRVGVQVFSHSELEEATRNFDSASELGHGGFGTVYFGKLRDGRAVAIKRLNQNDNKRVKQFQNEVEILSKLRHQNLVSLYGCTSRYSRELLLVFEYISNGTLADHLYGPKSKLGAFPWPTRLNIATEIASALLYLHASNIVHRDVKASNILLDENFCVKVADFGLSRLFPVDVSHVTTDPTGTPGYLDPEYHKFFQLTDKSDVYSFGVVLFELISSMPAVDTKRLDNEIKLVDMAVKKIQIQALHQLVDPSLGFESDRETNEMMTSVAALAFQCVQVERDFRPSMSVVWESLENIRNSEIKIPMAK